MARWRHRRAMVALTRRQCGARTRRWAGVTGMIGLIGRAHTSAQHEAYHHHSYLLPPPTHSTPLRHVCWLTCDRWWQGLIDSFSIYNYALQGDQAQALYQNRMGGCSVTNGASASTYPAAPPQATGSPTPKQVVYNTQDPTTICGTNCAYGYLASDPDDATCGLQQYHTGLLNLYGSQNLAVQPSARNKHIPSAARADHPVRPR